MTDTLPTIDGDSGPREAVPVVIFDINGAAVSGGTVANQGVVPGSTETKITAAVMPAGGVGFLGWLSAIWYQLTQALTAVVTGNAASATTDSGNPVKVGGIYNPAIPTFTTGQRTDLQADVNGNVRARVVALISSAADGVSNVIGWTCSSAAQTASAVPLAVSGFSLGGLASAPAWDRNRGLMEGVLLASAAKTTAQSVDFVNYLPRASLHIVINVTAGSGFSITPKIRARDPIVTAEYYDLLAGIAITATGRTVLKVGPGIAVAANAAASDLVPRNLNFQMAVADATSCTYSVAYVLG